jgi:protocatechuate 3,4-dioxygenase beta subunit
MAKTFLHVLRLVPLTLSIASAAANGAAPPNGRIVGLPCEGCEAIFDGMPAAPPPSARIAPPNEPGEPLILEGVVRDASGRAKSGIVVYVYQTNARGIYPRDSRFRGAAANHGRLRGWARTDAQGRYRFETIRPGGYPDQDLPQHIHMHVLEPGRCTYYVDDVMFEDDPRLTPKQRTALTLGRGGAGIVRPTRDRQGVWRVQRDLTLGRAIPGYEQCARR